MFMESEENAYILDHESGAEALRLISQDAILNEAMGGILPVEIAEKISSVLDVACGPGGWVLEGAYEYPHIAFTGIDISSRQIAYAREQAKMQGRSNVSFLQMDALQMYLPAEFDLVNARLLSGFMTPSTWPPFLESCYQLMKPGGWMRWTEWDMPLTTSEAFEVFSRLLAQALKELGRSYSPDGYHVGLTPVMPRLVRQAGFVNVRTEAFDLDGSYGRIFHSSGRRDAQLIFELAKPFLMHSGAATSEEVEKLAQGYLYDVELQDYCAVHYVRTVWGQKAG